MSSSQSQGSGAAPVVSGLRLGGRYVLRSPIAAGGMAQVWSGADELLDREVALKILHPHLATDDAFVARFRREAVASASLTHRSIVSVFDTISADGVEAIVMELIDGRTLRTVMDEVETLSPEEVIDLGVQISDALDVAHSAGIVHRDIKPANIMISTDDRIMVTDFGIAKAGTDADLTATGTLLGTAKYLSPEQVTGAVLDPRSDIYALGVVLYEALTGTVPFKASTDAATALARLHQTAEPIRKLRPEIPADLELVVNRAMARDPAKRYARAVDLRDALAAVGTGTAVMESPSVDLDGASADPGIDPLFEHAVAGRPVPPLPPEAGRTRPPDPPPNQGGALPDDAALSGSVAAEPPRPAGSAPPIAPLGDSIRPVGGPPGPVAPVAFARLITRGPVARLILLPAVLLFLGGLFLVTQLGSDDPADDDGSIGSSQIEGGDTDGDGNADGTSSTDQDSGEATTPSSFEFVLAQSFDPFSTDSDKLERQDLVGAAYDGDPATNWRTEGYSSADLGGLKPGVGLIVALVPAGPYAELDLSTNSQGWSADIYVAGEFLEGQDWGEPVASVENGGAFEQVDLAGAEGEYIMIWVRNTGTNQSGAFRFELNEIGVR